MVASAGQPVCLIAAPMAVNPETTVAACSSPAGLPPLLQHAVHRALTDLQAARLLYPQRCAAAEAACGDERPEAERRVLSSLGSTFDFAAARAELEQGRRAAKQLQRGRIHKPAGSSGSTGGSSGAYPSDAPAAEALPNGAGLPDPASAVWSSYEAFSAAVAAEVDRRIAEARLQPRSAGPAASGRLRQQQQAQLQELELRASGVEQAGKHPRQAAAGRQPLGSAQQQQAGRLPAAPAERKRERERSPPAAPAPASGATSGRRQRRAAAAAPASAAAGHAGSPATKRQRPHVAFGTRCDAPRSAAPRSTKPVKLNASQAPGLPVLPPPQPDAATGRPAGSEAGPAAAAAGAAPRSDLLRSLAAAFAGAGSMAAAREPDSSADSSGLIEEACLAGNAVSSAKEGGQARSAPDRLQCMLEDLTAALQGLTPPGAGSPNSAAGAFMTSTAVGAAAAPASAPASLQSVLEQHGIAPSAVSDASSLLQAALDRMDDIAARAAAPSDEPASPCEPATRTTASSLEPPLQHGSNAEEAGAVVVAQQQAAATAECSALAANPRADPYRSETAQLCRQFSQLLDSSDTELRQVRQELEAARRAETAAEKIGAAALQAALSAAEAAADAAVEAASSHARSRMPAVGPAGGRKLARAGSVELRCPVHTFLVPAVREADGLPGGNAAGCAAGAEPGAAPLHRPAPTAWAAEPVAAEGPVAGAIGTAAEPSASAGQPEVQPPPADGWPVGQQQAPPVTVTGVPLLPASPAEADGQTWQLVLPSASSVVSETAAMAAASAVHPTDELSLQLEDAAAPVLEQAWLSAVQPAAAQPAEEEVAFSVASDEPLPDSPAGSSSPSHAGDSSSYCSSLVAGSGQGKDESSLADEVCEQPPAAAAEVVAEQAGAAQQEDQHRLPAELAALSMQPASDAEQPAAVAAASGKEASAAGMPPTACADQQTGAGGTGAEQEQSSSPSEPSAAWLAGSPGWQAEEGEPDPYAAAPELAALEAEAVAAQLHPVLGLPAPAAAVPTSSPPAHLPPPRAPYDPLRADEERAAAARQTELAAGWRQLRQRADMLALWHEYATELSMDSDDAAAGASPAAGSALAAGGQATQPQQVEEPHMQAVWRRERSTDGASPGLAVPVLPPRQPHSRLWQPGRQPLLAPASNTAPLGTPALSAGLEDSDGGCDSSTPASSSCLTVSSEGASIGVAGRHKARALRYRLLRRQLAAAVGMESSPAATPAVSASSDGSSIAEEHSRDSSSGSESPFSQPGAGLAAAARPAAIGHPPTVIRVPAAGGASSAGEQQQHSAHSPGGVEHAVNESSKDDQLPVTPLAVSLALAAAETGAGGAAAGPAADLPGPVSNLADHLSDATPSSQASAAAPSSAGPPGSVTASSSCSTLHEVGSHWAGTAAGPGSNKLRQSAGRLEALQALKARAAVVRRSSSQLAA
ncbi:hypothetical protein ABPG75_009227 [Micractinium tetrahymenae]